jgi:hypothetical protein
MPICDLKDAFGGTYIVSSNSRMIHIYGFEAGYMSKRFWRTASG